MDILNSEYNNYIILDFERKDEWKWYDYELKFFLYINTWFIEEKNTSKFKYDGGFR